MCVLWYLMCVTISILKCGTALCVWLRHLMLQVSDSITRTGQSVRILWNGMSVANISLVTLSVVLLRVNVVSGTLFPLVCESMTGGQWLQPNGAWGQRNMSRGVELYRGAPSDFPHGVLCCTNTTVTFCVGMYSDLTLAASSGLPTSAPLAMLSL